MNTDLIVNTVLGRLQPDSLVLFAHSLMSSKSFAVLSRPSGLITSVVMMLCVLRTHFFNCYKTLNAQLSISTKN